MSDYVGQSSWDEIQRRMLEPDDDVNFDDRMAPQAFDPAPLNPDGSQGFGFLFDGTIPQMEENDCFPVGYDAYASALTIEGATAQAGQAGQEANHLEPEPAPW